MTLLRTLLAALGASLLAVVLSACTISSDKPLFDPAEAAAPLPDAFLFYSYAAKDGGYVRAVDGPASFVRQGSAYVGTIADTKAPMIVRFFPIGGETYVLTAADQGDPRAIYGFARYSDSVLAIALSPDKQTSAAIDRERAGAMPRIRRALSGLQVASDTDEIDLTDRAALDYLGQMYAAGRLPMDPPSVGYVALDADAAPPSRLVPLGAQWLRVP